MTFIRLLFLSIKNRTEKIGIDISNTLEYLMIICHSALSVYMRERQKQN